MKIQRSIYLTKLIDRMNNSLIKVITGQRRSGKSFLLFNLFKDYLISQNVDENHIIEIKLDQDNFFKLRNKDKLKKYIYSKIIDKGNYYILLDEIQYVNKFEPVLIELIRIENVDVYVTGSNSKFLSTDIDTALNGKNDSIHIFPLTFKEFITAYKDRYIAFQDFTKFGSLPQTLSCSKEEDKRNYLVKTFAELYVKDVVERYRIDSLEQLNEIIKVLASTIGSYLSIGNIIKTIKSVNNVKIKYETIAKYLKHLENAFIIAECERYELKGRKYIGANKKYYFEDIGIKNSILNFKQNDVSHTLENIIYNELIKFGYKVDVGVVPVKVLNEKTNKYEYKQLEVDFVAGKLDAQYLIQVCTTLSDKETLAREATSLNKSKSNALKMIITLDNIPSYLNEDGIHIINVYDFLLNFLN